MKKGNSKYIKITFPKKNNNIYGESESKVNIRRKTLSILDSKLKFSFRHLNTLLDKINNVKDLIVFNKYDTRDIRSLKKLDYNALLFSHTMNKEIKKTSELLYAYNLSSHDLDNFMEELEIEKKERNKKNEVIKLYNVEHDYNLLKKEFDLIKFIKGKTDNIPNLNDSFLENQRKNRDLYNLKLELFLKDQKKKIGPQQYFEIVKKAPPCLIERDKRVNPRYSTIKSKYYEKYKKSKLSKSLEIEEAMREKEILNEEEKNALNEDKIAQMRNNKIQNDIRKSYNYFFNKNNLFNNKKRFIQETIKEKEKKYQKDNNTNLIKKPKLLLKNNIKYKTIQKESNINNEKIKKKPSSANINNKNYNKYKSLTFNSNISQVNINKSKNINANLKILKKNRVNSSNNSSRKNYNINKYNSCSTIFQNNVINKHKRNRPISPQLITKRTYYSSTASSRAISAFSSRNDNNTIYKFNNDKTIIINKKLKNNNISNYRKKSSFNNYINEINKIIKYSNYTTNNFKNSTKNLNKNRLFQKSNNDIFEKETYINIDKIKENLKLDKNRHSSVDEKKLLYNNTKRVKLMLTPKNRRILNTILMELFDKQKRANNFYSDMTLYEKMIQKSVNNKKFVNLTNEMMKYEKDLDKETILEIFKRDEEKIISYLKEINNKENYIEEEWKHVMLKHKNMKMINEAKLNKISMNGNLHKKHLLSKFK